MIAILGILAAVAVFAIGGTTSQSKAASCKSDVATVQTASDAYYVKTGAYAVSIATLAAPGVNQTLRTAPVATNGYVISLSSSTGAVTAAPVCTAIP